MATTDNSGGNSQFREFRDHLRKEWRATLFIVAAMFIIHHKTNWLDPIDNYAFALIGHPGDAEFLAKPRDEKAAMALVVLIDETANAINYHDRSPLNRCQLLHDLQVVYSAMERSNQEIGSYKLDLMVVDIDISPALWLLKASDSPPEKKCEDDLYAMINEHAQKGIRTVLMTPFQVGDSGGMAIKEKWLAEMDKPGVLFGFPELPVKHGWVNKYYEDPCALAKLAYDSATSPSISCSKRAIENLKDSSVGGIDQGKLGEIDTRTYKQGLKLIELNTRNPDTRDTCGELFKDRLGCMIGFKVDSSQAANTAKKHNFKAVFFGAGFGETDIFVTPLGTLYGVEVHAAAFLTLNDPLKKESVAALLFDVVFGFIFGWLITSRWRAYFSASVSDMMDTRTRAPIYLLELSGLVFGALCLLTVFAWFLIHRFGIWTSPIPIALGMLGESFVSASVAGAIHEIRAARRANLPSVPAAHGAAHLSCAKKWNAMSPLSRALVITDWLFWMGVVCFAIYIALFEDHG